MGNRRVLIVDDDPDSGAVTGIDFKSTAGEPEWLPVNGFLDKPVEPQVLLDEVKRLLCRRA